MRKRLLILAAIVGIVLFAVNRFTVAETGDPLYEGSFYGPYFIPIPTKADTIVDATNKKLLIVPFSLTTAGLDSATFIRSLSYAATAIADSVGLGDMHFIGSQPDSFIVFVRADSISVLCGVHVTITGRSGAVVLAQTVYPSIVNAWTRKVFYREAAVIPQDYKVVYRIKAFKGRYIDITPITMKKAG